jgi:hypothetical protein
VFFILAGLSSAEPDGETLTAPSTRYMTAKVS